METLQSNQQKTSSHQTIPLSSPPILHQQSLNIQRSNSVPFRQVENLIDFTTSHKNGDQNTTTSLNEAQNCPKNKHMHKNSIISNAIAEIDDFERDDLLLSSSTIRTEDLINEHQTVCKQHNKVEDIICLIQKIKICSYCALFGPHKDHTFKTECQLLQDIGKIESKIRETDKIYKVVQKQFSYENSLKLIQQYCEAKKQESIYELEQEVNGIIQKIRRTKEEIKIKTISQFDNVVKEIEENWQNTAKNINKLDQYDLWRQKGLKILNNFSQKIESCNFIEAFKQYQKFQWEKGAFIVDKYKEILRNFTKRSQESLDDLKFNYSYSIKNILANTIQFDSQRTIQMLNQTPTSSLQDLHRQLSFTFKSEALQNSCKIQPLQSKQKIRIRNSEVIQSRLQPIQEQMARNIRYTRCSFNSGNKRIRNETSFVGNNCSTMLTRQRSNPRLQQTMKSPNSRASIYKSPSHYRANRNPLQILSNYERNKNQTSLNFSKCGLKSDQLVYFVEKAFNSHIPIDLNLQRNKLSISGLAKLLPLISKVVSVNLSKTQLDESCLQALCKIKVIRRLYEVNLSQNDISQHKNLGKLQQLRKMGFKIII